LSESIERRSCCVKEIIRLEMSILGEKGVSRILVRSLDVDFLIMRQREREREKIREFSISPPPLSQPLSSRIRRSIPSRTIPDSRSSIKKGRPPQPFIPRSRLSTYVIIGLGQSQKESAAAGTAAALFTLINSTRRAEACQATP